MPLFSVIVSVYNVEQYIDRCIQSILNQSYKNFELILVDDGATDNSGTICDKYVVDDERVRIIHQENKGVSAARNAGIELAEGEYLYFVDSDDWIENDALQVLADDICLNKPDVIIFGYKEISSTATNSVVMIESKEHIDAGLIKENLICDKWRNYVWNKCFRRKLFTGIEFPVGRIYEDLYIVPTVVYGAKTISILPDVLYNYNRENITSITSFTNSYKLHEFFIAILQNYKLAVSNNLPYVELCRCRVIEGAQIVLLWHLKDGLLDSNKVELLAKYCTISSITSLKNPELRYKCFRRNAIIELKRRNLLQYIANLYYYLIYKIRYKTWHKNSF